MNQISIMTINPFVEKFMMYQHFHDKEMLEDEYEEMMAAIHEAGYQAVDVTVMETQIFPVDYILQVLKKYELSVSSYICFLEFANPDEKMEERIALAKKQADLAAALGTKILMLVPTAHEGIEEMRPDEIRQTMIRHWNEVVPYARQLGLHPVIEDTPNLKLCLDKADEVKEVLDAVEGLELVYDSGNMILDGEDPVEYVKKFAGRIGFAHLKDMAILGKEDEGSERMRDGRATKCVATGSGIIDIKGVIRALLETGYTGGMTVEYGKDPEKTHLESFVAASVYGEECIRECVQEVSDR